MGGGARYMGHDSQHVEPTRARTMQQVVPPSAGATGPSQQQVMYPSFLPSSTPPLPPVLSNPPPQPIHALMRRPDDHLLATCPSTGLLPMPKGCPSASNSGMAAGVRESSTDGDYGSMMNTVSLDKPTRWELCRHCLPPDWIPVVTLGSPVVLFGSPAYHHSCGDGDGGGGSARLGVCRSTGEAVRLVSSNGCTMCKAALRSDASKNGYVVGSVAYSTPPPPPLREYTNTSSTSSPSGAGGPLSQALTDLPMSSGSGSDVMTGSSRESLLPTQYHPVCTVYGEPESHDGSGEATGRRRDQADGRRGYLLELLNWRGSEQDLLAAQPDYYSE